MMEDVASTPGVHIKEEKLDTPPHSSNLLIKDEPLSPDKCPNHHPPPPPILPYQQEKSPSKVNTPDNTTATPLQNEGTSSKRPVGKFASNRSNLDKIVDLSSYKYGLYSYYAEGNADNEFNAPYFDPYFGQNDIKDPALLARAKRYFESLRNERAEIQDEFQMRDQSSPLMNHEHLPMYQRKRKKVQRLVVVVPKIPISSSIKEFLRKRYPCDSLRAARWAARKKCRNSESPGVSPQSAAQEDKLQEFLLQFQAGATDRHSKPYSVSHKTATPLPCREQNQSMSSQQNHSISSQNSKQLCSEQTVPMLPHYSKPACSNEKEPPKMDQIQPQCHAPLAPLDVFIKPEPVDCDHASSEKLLTPKQEMWDCPHQGMAQMTNSVEQEKMETCANDFQNTENLTPNIPTNVPQPVTTESTTAKSEETNRKKKKKKAFHPYVVKEEKISADETDTIEDVQNTSVPGNPSFDNITDSVNKNDVTDSVADSVNTDVQIKQEPLDADQMLMVEIFRKRVKKLRKIEVKPLVQVKEEPTECDEPFGSDFEDVDIEPPVSPQIKEEPMEPTLLYFVPRPPIKKNTMTPKFVYGKRIHGRARMSASHPHGRISRDTESEFDTAAQLKTPFSPPRSAWSTITTTVNNQPDEEKDENAGVTAEIDKLIEAGNIVTLDDTEKMYNLFAATIRNITDSKANVFNIVLEKFKASKEMEESLKMNEYPEKSQPHELDKESPKKQILFPMSDQEIYNQGLAIIDETKPPGEFELPTVKIEREDFECEDLAVQEEFQKEDLSEAIGNEGTELMIEEHVVSESEQTPVPPENSLPHYSSDCVVEYNENTDTSTADNQEQEENINVVISQVSDQQCYEPAENSLESCNRISPMSLKPNILKHNNYNPMSLRPDYYQTVENTYHVNASGPSPYKSDDENMKVLPESISRQKAGLTVTEAERLFDEMLSEEQVPFQAQENAYMEPYPRNDNLFSNSSLDDFIKAPLNTNEHLVKPKPSYVRLNYHDSSESTDVIKPPTTVLFSSKPEDIGHKDNPEWSHWRRHHESFDQFQSSSWSIDDQNSWSPQHSTLYDPYFEQPSSSSTSFEDPSKEINRLNTFVDNNAMPPWLDSRRLPIQGTMPIIERSPSGEEIIRIPVEQRTVQTQFPNNNKHCSAIEVSIPILTFFAQRQDNVKDFGTQTDILPAYSGWMDYYSPHSSVLVEPLLSARKVPRRTPTNNTSSGEAVLRLPVEQRTIQTQYPANNSMYTAFEPSLPFLTYSSPNKSASDFCSQTGGSPLFPPWVAPGRFRRHRPVLVEPLPNIEPIGENVRTMRSSDAYSILMEQIRTSNDPSFDKFMNSQKQPNGIVSRFNKYACYAPQSNSPEMPLTVKKNYPRKNGNVGKGKRPGIKYKEVTPKPSPSQHSNRGLTPYQISVKIRKMGQVENIIGRLSSKKRKSPSPKSAR